MLSLKKHLIFPQRRREFFEKIFLREGEFDEASCKPDFKNMVDYFAPKLNRSAVGQREKNLDVFAVFDIARTQHETAERIDVADRSRFSTDQTFPFDFDFNAESRLGAAVAPASAIN